MNHKRFFVVLAAAAVVISVLLLLKSSPAATGLIWQLTDGGSKLFPLVSIAALIDSINPCAFSILLLTIALLFSLGIFQRGKILQIGSAYIFGIFIAYSAIGLGILSALHLFNVPHFMGKLGAVLLVAMGLINLVGYFFPTFPVRLQIPHAAHGKIADLMKQASIPAVFLLGVLVGLCEFPCTGGPYLLVLGLLHDAQTKLKGLIYLLWYNLLFILPLLVVLFVASERVVLEKLQTWKKNNLKTMRLGSAIIMIALGILVFFI